MNDNIIQFPIKKVANENYAAKIEAARLARMHYEDIAQDSVANMVDILVRHGYHPLDNKAMVNDLGVILNLIIAMMYRTDGEPHFLHETIDEIDDLIKYVKSLNKNGQQLEDMFTSDE
jgi:hypothetical protein